MIEFINDYDTGASLISLPGTVIYRKKIDKYEVMSDKHGGTDVH